MSHTEITHGQLHSTILRYIIEHGFAPHLSDIVTLLNAAESEVAAALTALQDYHGVVLHPGTSRIWVIHPFALAPTNFVVRTAQREWWGNCAWCSLGVAALLNQDVTITTALGADRQQVSVHIQNGQIVESGYVIHFPIPMTQAWDNVIYTCSTMLLFEGEGEVDRWSVQHRIPKGDVQPIAKIWDFAREWYGNHLNPQWEKWTNRQAQAIFQRHGLTHAIWHIPQSNERF